MATRSLPYKYDDHAQQPFKLVHLKPSLDGDKGVQAHRHHCYEMFFFRSGGGKHLIDFNVFDVESNSIHFVPPASVHLLQRNEHTKGFVLLFSMEMGAEFLQARDRAFFKTKYEQAPSLSLDAKTFETVSDYLLKMDEEWKGGEAYWSTVVGGLLSVLMALLHRERKRQGNELRISSPEAHSERFLSLLDQHFHQWQKADLYAEALGINEKQLQQVCKKDFGKSVRALIQERVLLEAKRLLYHSDKNSNEIAYLLNFNDPAYFGRFFKKHSGFSPQQFRKQSREKYQIL